MKYRAIHIAAGLAVLFATPDVLALGAEDLEAPAASTSVPAKAETAKPKAPAAKPKPASPQASCPPPARTEHFVAGQTYRLQTKRGYVSEIRLGAGDSVSESAFSGDTDGWNIASIIGSNVVTVKPGSKAYNTNLILRSRDRSYLIALEIIPDHSICKGEWQLNFATPAPPVLLMPETADALAARNRARQAEALHEAKATVPAGRNWAYSMQALPGSDDIIPTEVYDDGRFTYIRIPGNRELPSIFQIAADGTETIIERHMEARDLIVIHEVGKQWVLRLDKQTVGLWNDAFDIEGNPPVANARSARIRRVVRGADND